jgi:predicted RNA binding protein YcfA (HicA-like mRNA interferase family)
MTKVPPLPYYKIIKALQRGSHIRLQKHFEGKVLKNTVSAHTSVKRSTLSQILKQAKIELEDFLNLI